MADSDNESINNPMLQSAQMSHIEYLRKTERRKNSAQVATKVAMRRDERLERERIRKEKEAQLAITKANEVQYDDLGKVGEGKERSERQVRKENFSNYRN